MRLNLSSQIAFNKVPEEYYHPRSAVERSELTRREKIPTDIFPKMEEGAQAIVDAVEKLIKQKDSDGRMCVLGLGTGTSLTPIYEEMVRRYEAGQLSFHNVIVFNAYEYYPLKPDDKNSCIRQLHARLLDRVDIAPQNIFSPDSTINQNYVLNYCRQYEQRINSWTYGQHRYQRAGIYRYVHLAPDPARPRGARGNVDELCLAGLGAALLYYDGYCHYPQGAQDLSHGLGRE